MAKRKKFVIILPEEKSSVQAILSYGRSVLSGLKSHPDKFPEPTPTPAALETALDELEAANLPEGDMSDNARIMLHEKKRIVLGVLRELSAYVIGVSKGDRFTASLSGFKLSAEETKATQQGEILIKYIKPGLNSGEAIVRIGNRGGHDLFIVSLKKADGEFVMLDAFSLSTFTIKGLPSGSSVILITGKKSDVAGASVEAVAKAV